MQVFPFLFYSPFILSEKEHLCEQLSTNSATIN